MTDKELLEKIIEAKVDTTKGHLYWGEQMFLFFTNKGLPLSLDEMKEIAIKYIKPKWKNQKS